MQNTGTLEEATVAENEPQPEIPTTPPKNEAEVTALVPTEPEVIEGEVIEIVSPEDPPPPKQKPYWLLVVGTVLICLSFLAGSFLLPFVTPSATVTLFLVERSLSTTTTIYVQGRALAPLTLSQSTNALATGKGHQNATNAHGTITFYNGAFTTQTIAAGTIVTGKDGAQGITDQAAIIPAGNPPSYGQVTVSAHAVIAGPQGNIQAFDMNTACCGTSVLAKNSQPFTGGTEARDFTIVTKADIANAASPLQATLSRSEYAALAAQLTLGEELTTPTCTPRTSSNHLPGDETTQVRITVSETCYGIAYSAQTLQQNAIQLLIMDATTKLGANYALIGDIQVTIIQTKVINPHQGLVNTLVHEYGTWAYQMNPGIQERQIKLVAGKGKQQAISLLLSQPGIQGVQITVKGGNQTLPQDPRSIHIILVYREI